MTGQAGAVTSGPFDANQAHGPEAAQPSQQIAISSPGGREALHSEQSANVVKRSSHMHIGVGVHTAGDGVSIYDGQSHPFQG